MVDGAGAVDRARHRLGQSAFARRAAGSVHGVLTREQLFALTFDDGPDPNVTPGVLELLAQRNGTATFFMPAERALAHPDLARRVAALGNEVGVHGFRHERITELGLAGFRRETTLARRELRRILGTTPRWFRPPFGAQNLRTFLATRVQGMDVAVWASDISDAITTIDVGIEPGPSGTLLLNAGGIQTTCTPGAILLLHDTPARDDPPADAPARKLALIGRILTAIDSLGGRVVTLSEILRHGAADRRIWRSAGY
ncbi:MAG TPA: polysaccharide deacetylase family protein [Acidimicrobiia bacterium]|nr:polysaccharide deacetylase family protein [Acidimicrobiia bacterium]